MQDREWKGMVGVAWPILVVQSAGVCAIQLLRTIIACVLKQDLLTNRFKSVSLPSYIILEGHLESFLQMKQASSEDEDAHETFIGHKGPLSKSSA